jgi:hypothetical protein
VDEGQVVLKHELHLHQRGLEERLRLEDDGIPHCEVGVRLHSVDLALTFRIDEETLPRVGHYEGVGQLDDFLEKLRGVIFHYQVIQDRALQSEMVRRQLEFFLLWLLWLDIQSRVRMLLDRTIRISCQQDSLQDVVGALEDIIEIRQVGPSPILLACHLCKERLLFLMILLQNL